MNGMETLLPVPFLLLAYFHVLPSSSLFIILFYLLSSLLLPPPSSSDYLLKTANKIVSTLTLSVSVGFAFIIFFICYSMQWLIKYKLGHK